MQQRVAEMEASVGGMSEPDEWITPGDPQPGLLTSIQIKACLKQRIIY